MAASRKYAVEEANRLVKWLTETFRRIHDGSEAHRRARAELETLGRATRANGHGDLDRRVRTAEQMVQKRESELRELFASVAEKDIEVRDIDMGLVDFLGERDGKDVWLCWRLGEPEVAHWHEIDRGFKDRKPL